MTIPEGSTPGITIDSRLGGMPRYLLGDEWHLMRVPDEIRKCACFVGYRAADGKERVAGTAFFLARAVEDREEAWGYVVTARHVIEAIRDLGLDRVLLRINTKSAAQWGETALSSWVFHPSDESVDVAARRFEWQPDAFDHLGFNVASSATHEVIREFDLGVGTEVFLTGLFSHHYGRTRNIPLVRVGNIAAIPEEQVMTSRGAMDAYLIECRSLGGLSGSPVFAHADPVRRIGETHVSLATGASYLLGLIHGHFDAATFAADAEDTDALASAGKINVGIAIVVPVEKILETINQRAFRDLEVAAEEHMRTQRLPTPD